MFLSVYHTIKYIPMLFLFVLYVSLLTVNNSLKSELITHGRYADNGWIWYGFTIRLQVVMAAVMLPCFSDFVIQSQLTFQQ